MYLPVKKSPIISLPASLIDKFILKLATVLSLRLTTESQNQLVLDVIRELSDKKTESQNVMWVDTKDS